MEEGDFTKLARFIQGCGPSSLIGPLLSLLLADKEVVRWRAITTLGMVVESLANSNMERARVFMRRCMWMLTDESGGVGWGIPEVMGEVMSRVERVAVEFSSILISYVLEEEGRPDNFLEYTPLRRGAWWGIARLAQGIGSQVLPWVPLLKDSLGREEDPFILAHGLLLFRELYIPIGEERLLHDHRRVLIYWNLSLKEVTISSLARGSD